MSLIVFGHVTGWGRSFYPYIHNLAESQIARGELFTISVAAVGAFFVCVCVGGCLSLDTKVAIKRFGSHERFAWLPTQ